MSGKAKKSARQDIIQDSTQCAECCQLLLAMPNGPQRHLFAMAFATSTTKKPMRRALEAREAAGYPTLPVEERAYRSARHMLTTPRIAACVSHHMGVGTETWHDEREQLAAVLWEDILAEPGDVMTIEDELDEEGEFVRSVARLYPWDELDPDTRRTIRSVDFYQDGTVRRIAMADPDRARDTLAKLRGLYAPIEHRILDEESARKELEGASPAELLELLKLMNPDELAAAGIQLRRKE